MTKKKRYDDVRIVNAVDGTVIEGHDAVQAHFEREKHLMTEHGSTIYIQVYRANLNATTIEEFQGALIAEIKIDGNSVSGSDTVASVKEMVLALTGDRGDTTPDLEIGDGDCITLFLSGRPLQDDSLFYADNFILLPVWIQCCIHACDGNQFLARLNKLIRDRAG